MREAAAMVVGPRTQRLDGITERDYCVDVYLSWLIHRTMCTLAIRKAAYPAACLSCYQIYGRLIWATTTNPIDDIVPTLMPDSLVAVEPYAGSSINWASRK